MHLHTDPRIHILFCHYTLAWIPPSLSPLPVTQQPPPEAGDALTSLIYGPSELSKPRRTSPRNRPGPPKPHGTSSTSIFPGHLGSIFSGLSPQELNLLRSVPQDPNSDPTMPLSRSSGFSSNHRFRTRTSLFIYFQHLQPMRLSALAHQGPR
jgi:hypothetical protein